MTHVNVVEVGWAGVVVGVLSTLTSILLVIALAVLLRWWRRRYEA